jgi:hypothetical protein
VRAARVWQLACLFLGTRLVLWLTREVRPAHATPSCFADCNADGVVTTVKNLILPSDVHALSDRRVNTRDGVPLEAKKPAVSV